MDIIESIHAEQIFKPLFRDLRTWENWFVCMKAIFGLEMDMKERRIYRKFTGRTDRPSKQFSEAFLAIGRRGGKTFTTALCMSFLATFRDWNLGLEKGYIMCIATDKKQAGVMLDYVRQILQLPIFKSMVVAERAEEIELSNRMVIAVHTCSYRSLRGYQICAVSCDEINFWRHEGSNPSREVLTALRPSLGNVEGSLLLAISSSYSRSGPLFEMYRDKYGKNDPECLVWKAGTQDMNPTYSTTVIQRALNDDYAVARAEYFSEFRADLESFLTTSELENAIVPDRHVLPPQPNISYVGFCDVGGGRVDDMTLSLCHSEGQTIIQDCLQIRKPPFNPDTVVQEFAAVLKSYNVHVIEGDRYAAQFVVSAFANHGILYEAAALSKSDIYLNARAVFSTGRVELLDNGQQTAELRQLERRTGQQKDTVNHPPGLHDDAANAICGAIVMAVGAEHLKTPPMSRGISEPVAGTEEDKMQKEAVSWLLGIPKKTPKPDEIDLEQLEYQIFDGLEEEIRDKKKSSEGMKLKRGWED